MGIPTRYIICKMCGKRELHKARVLCQNCYVKAKNNGTLNKYPTVTKRTGRRKTFKKTKETTLHDLKIKANELCNEITAWKNKLEEL